MEESMISKELKEKIKAAETLEDVVKVCAEDGIEVTKEKLEAELAQTEGGELSEDALDNVNGEIATLAFHILVWWINIKKPFFQMYI